MNDPTDDIMRSFLNLHPDTPIDGTEFALPLRTIKMLVKAVEYKAFQTGHAFGADEENKRCRNMLMDMHEKANGMHNYYHCAANEMRKP